MIKLTAEIVFNQFETMNFTIFEIQAHATELSNISPAIKGERDYNGAEIDFGGLIYPKNME